jgi:hypothetical protein
MQKIYVLLRHDKQTGPYSLPELIQYDLKPYDLIWIEGQSAGWYYPQEIAALHPYLSFLPQKPAAVHPVPPAQKKVAVQRPALNETLPADLSPGTAAPAPTEIYTPFKPASENLEAAVYAQFRQPAAEKEPTVVRASVPQKKRSPNAVVVGVITVLIVGGVFAASWIMNRQPNEQEPVTETIVETTAQNEIAPPALATDDNTKKTGAVSSTGQKRPRNSSLPTSVTTGVKPIAQQTKVEKKDTGYSAEEATGYEMTGKTIPDEPTVQNENSSAADEETNIPQEKKKTLKDRFLDLFRKKPEEKQTEESRSAGTENGERVATRRENNLLQLVHVRFDVPNDWMMGIKGAKATMVNRSSEKIRTANVEVFYYNDDNELLQKKVIAFEKIDARESGTISIPDHPTATKVDYKVLTVNGAGQPSA